MNVQFLSLALESNDWGEANLNPMVRAFGLKKGKKAKCKSCVFYINRMCVYRDQVAHNKDFRACARYQNKRKLKI